MLHSSRSEAHSAITVPLAYGHQDNRERFEGRTGLIPDPVSMAASASGFSLSLILNPERLNRLSQQHASNSDVPSPVAVVNQLFSTLINDWQSQPEDPVNQRVLVTAANALVNTMQDEGRPRSSPCVTQSDRKAHQ